jgi:hypothetical protein
MKRSANDLCKYSKSANRFLKNLAEGRGIKENLFAKPQFTGLLLGSAAVDPGQQL